jgi:hypothetical protein
VSDLQKRKPALWLPPGSVCEEDQPRPAKARRESSGLSIKRTKSGDDNKRRESQSDLSKAKTKRESSGATSLEQGVDGLEGDETAETKDSEAMEEPLGHRPAALKPPVSPKERKLNPNAKRPASIRDHKQNGAYLVWKIMDDLRRIAGGARQAEDKGRTQVRAGSPQRERGVTPATVYSGSWQENEAESEKACPRNTGCLRTWRNREYRNQRRRDGPCRGSGKGES